MIHNPVLVLICNIIYTILGLLAVPLGLYVIVTAKPEEHNGDI
jgi:hypothetical protein